MQQPIPSVSSSSRKSTQLNSSLEKKLLGYAALAGAGSVVLGLAPLAQAEVVYTATHKMIHRFGEIPVDLNGDGIVDFTFVAGSSRPARKTFSTRTSASIVLSAGAEGNLAWGHGGQTPYVSALPAGAKIGPSVKFADSNRELGRVSAMNGASPGYFFPWAPKGGNVQNHYVGLQFLIDGQVHYGWARLSVQIRPAEKSGVLAVLTGYAYETVANKPIEAGRTSGTDAASVQPATLGNLALGATGIAAWRREESN
jgi:hypothetical protein